MKGFYISMDGKHLEKATIESMELRLLAKGDGTEVIMQKIEAGKVFYIFPCEDMDLFEFFFIVKGTCEYNEENQSTILEAGQYFYAHKLQDTVIFKALTDMQLLWVSSQPTFHLISESVNELIKLVKKVEEKDQYTYKHSIRVQMYSLIIAREMNLSKDTLENLYFASLFHDVGKINVSKDILNKPGRLTDDEFEEMKQHSVSGYNMLKSSYYEHIGDIILQHHERIDGSGYPSGLKSDDILLEAKIIAVADTYDAMTSTRTYRRGLDPQLAVDELKKHAGTLYDGVIVEALEQALIKDGVLPSSDS
ncbi:MAG TPA: HD-GYP domain-containing protein [Bacillaceae bacterium]